MWSSRYTLTTRHLPFKGEELKLDVHWNCARYLRATCSSFLLHSPFCPFPTSPPPVYSLPFFHSYSCPYLCFNLPSCLPPSLCLLPTLCFPSPPCFHLSSPPSPLPICLFPSPLSQIDHAVVASLFTDSRGHETLAASHRQLRGFLIDVDGDILKELSPEPGKPDKVGSSAIVLQTTDAWALTMTYQV